MKKTLGYIAAAMLAATPALAEFPERDVEIIVPFTPGGGFDTFVRALAPAMQRALPNDVNVVVQNVPGAGGRRGSTQVYRADPDGYTIGAFNMPGMLIEQLREGDGVGYDIDQVTWLATIGVENYAMIVKADSPINTVDDLKALGRPVSYAATGPSSTAYTATDLSTQLLGIETNIITGYEGASENILAVIRGDADAAVANHSLMEGYLETGDIKIVADYATDSAYANAPDATDLGVAELADINLTRLIGAPPGLPDDVRMVLENAITTAIADPEFTAWLESTGNTIVSTDGAGALGLVEEMKAFYARYADRL